MLSEKHLRMGQNLNKLLASKGAVRNCSFCNIIGNSGERYMLKQKPTIFYENTVTGAFVRRWNRFTAEVLINGETELVHYADNDDHFWNLAIRTDSGYGPEDLVTVNSIFSKRCRCSKRNVSGVKRKYFFNHDR